MQSKFRARVRSNWIVLITVAVGVPIFSLWNYRGGTSTSTVTLISAGISLVFLLGALLWGFQKAHQGAGGTLPKSVLLGAVFLGAISFAITVIGVSSMRHHNDLMDIALSDTPLSDIQSERKRLVVELIRRKAANSRENDKVVAQMRMHPVNPQVYTIASFANKETMQSTLSQLSTVTQADQQYNSQQQAATDDFRRKMAACDPKYLESFERDDKPRADAENATVKMEAMWFASVKKLYEYAQDHANEFSTSGGKIGIADPAVRSEFSNELQHSEALHDELVKRVQEALAIQKTSKDALVYP